MDNNFSIFKSLPATNPPNIAEPLKKTKNKNKVSESAKDRLPSFKEVPLRTYNSIKNNLNEFSKKIARTAKLITLIFNYVVFDKKIKPFIKLKRPNTSSKQTEIFKNSVNSPKSTILPDIVPLNLRKVVPKLENSQTLRIESATKKKVNSKIEVKKLINKKLSPDVKEMNRSCLKSSKILRNLASAPAANGASISCKEALQHLAKINTELASMKSSTQKVHEDLDELSLLLKDTKKSFDYGSLSQEQKKVFVDAREQSSDLAQAIGPVKDSFATSIHAAFGTKKEVISFEHEMVIEMHNPLLNCQVTINSKEDFKKFQAECRKSNKLLSSFRTDIPYITRFAAEDSFHKVKKEVQYRK